MRWGLAVLSAGFATAAWGSCIPAVEFGQLAPSCGGGSSYCYVTTPGAGTTASLAGSFWTFGVGDPRIGVGNDSGTITVDHWLVPAGSGFYLHGFWDEFGIDGCPRGWIMPGKPAEIMVAELEDSGFSSFFAVAAVRRFSSDAPEFDFTLAAGGGQPRDISLVEAPRARVVASTRDHFVFGSPDFASVSAGVFTDGSATAGELVAGYRVFRWAPPGSPTSFRKSAGWEAITPTQPFGQDVIVPVDLFDPRSYAYGLVFESGFETAYVGPYITSRSYCHPTDADGDGSPDAYGDPECCPIIEACDCNDQNPAIHPGATELCNGVDDNCDGVVDNIAPLGTIMSVGLDKVPGATRIDWTAAANTPAYDVVRGDLTVLHDSGGSFAASTGPCVASSLAATTLDDPDGPDPGQSLWYLIRPRNCAGPGSYDMADPTQAAPRDAGIAASGQSCP